jgi:hypothetical protein
VYFSFFLFRWQGKMTFLPFLIFTTRFLSVVTRQAGRLLPAAAGLAGRRRLEKKCAYYFYA